MSKTEKLTQGINNLYSEKKEEVDGLKTEGPRGGRNAASIPGWAKTGDGTLSKAFRASNCPTCDWWDGPRRTPNVAVPETLLGDAFALKRHLFGGM